MQKVGGSLSKHDIVNEVFNTVGEVAKKSDFISAGLKEQDIYTFLSRVILNVSGMAIINCLLGMNSKKKFSFPN